ncbi:MAG TPA: hypothetical protein PLK78_05455 [Verrucomicrobiota bacterium]|nr:hypothetical protein [Verrucomicrobiota bacterium]
MLKTTAMGREGSFAEGAWDGTLAFFVLRFWLGLRALLTGIEKYAGVKISEKPFIDPETGMEDPSGALIEVREKFYALTNYAAIPPSMQERFAEEPLLPAFLSVPFYACLGWVLILSGVMLLIGLGTRVSLVIQGLLYGALTVGLILIKEDAGIAWLGVHVALVALALMLAGHNRFAVLKKW